MARVRGGNTWRERGDGSFGESEGREYFARVDEGIFGESLVRARGGNIWRHCGEEIFGESEGREVHLFVGSGGEITW